MDQIDNKKSYFAARLAKATFHLNFDFPEEMFDQEIQFEVRNFLYKLYQMPIVQLPTDIEIKGEI